MFEALNNIRIVLVNTTHPGNIGGAARAMKNMGLTKLTLVEPKDFPSDRAKWRAASALDVLEQAVIVPTLEEAVADCALVVGTSARERRIPWPVEDPRVSAEKAVEVAGRANGKVAIVFGREDRGLTNEELHACNFHLHIPASEEYSSLNLGAAVQVVCYELRMALLGESRADNLDHWDQEFATADDIERLLEHYTDVMTALKFYKPETPKQLLTRMRRMFLRGRLDKMEVNILRGILTATEKHLPPPE